MDNLFVNPEVAEIIRKFGIIRDIGLSPSASASNRKPLKQEGIDAVISVLESGLLNNLNGYFQNHRSTSPYAILDNEYKVQDLLFCLLHPLIPDLHYEDPKSKTTGSLSHVRIDFTSKSLNFYLEVKHIDSKEKARTAEAEISEDITKYGKTSNFGLLIFFVYSYGYNLPNKRQFEEGFSGPHKIMGHSFKTICIVN
jgi:hypothetical protein